MELTRLRPNRAVVILILLAAVIFVIYVLARSGHSNYAGKTIKISKLLSASIYLAEESGEKIAEIRQNQKIPIKVKDRKQKQKKYVTLAVHKSHDIITNGLLSMWPSLRFRSKETDMITDEPTRRPPLSNTEIDNYLKRDEAVNIKDIGVWIDPLDASQEYAEGGKDPKLLEYITILVCIVVKNVPIASVIHQPFFKGIDIKFSFSYTHAHTHTHSFTRSYDILNYLFTGKEKQGITYWSWVNHGVSSSVVQGAQLSTSSNNIRIISSRSHTGNVKDLTNKAFKGQTIQHTIAGGAGYKSLQVAQRKADLYFHTKPINKWSTCAGNALLSALGGEMTTRKGNLIDYSLQSESTINDGLIATLSEEKHKQYLNKLKL